MQRLFKQGDKVRFTHLMKAKYPKATCTTGVVTSDQSEKTNMICVRKDNGKGADVWHKDYWELVEE